MLNTIVFLGSFLFALLMIYLIWVMAQDEPKDK
jgi:hypothetical protein